MKEKIIEIRYRYVYDSENRFFNHETLRVGESVEVETGNMDKIEHLHVSDENVSVMFENGYKWVMNTPNDITIIYGN